MSMLLFKIYQVDLGFSLSLMEFLFFFNELLFEVRDMSDSRLYLLLEVFLGFLAFQDVIDKGVYLLAER